MVRPSQKRSGRSLEANIRFTFCFKLTSCTLIHSTSILVASWTFWIIDIFSIGILCSGIMEKKTLKRVGSLVMGHPVWEKPISSSLAAVLMLLPSSCPAAKRPVCTRVIQRIAQMMHNSFFCMFIPPCSSSSSFLSFIWKTSS